MKLEAWRRQGRRAAPPPRPPSAQPSRTTFHTNHLQTHKTSHAMRPPVIHNAGETAGGTRMRLEISRYDYFVSVETRVAMGGAAEGEDGVKGDKRGE
jgi:hypothetical protein